MSRVGIFEGASDVGDTGRAGAVAFSADSNEYVVTGGGENVWGVEDAFHYLWRKGAGDLVLTASVRWRGQGRHPHRKAGWMVRRGLEPDAPYVDAVVHGDGLICLQYRKDKGGPTEEIQSPIPAPAVIRLERHADVFTLSVSRDGKSFQPVGSLSASLGNPVHVGLMVCSHDNSTTETAVFSNVDSRLLGQAQAEDRVIESTLETICVQTGERRVVYRARRHFEAPNWSPDGSYLLFNGDGRLYTIPVVGREPRQLDTGPADRCNNDHGFSPDGKWLAISHHDQGDSRIFILPSGGGTPRLVTPLGPSYWHGWSPDGRTLAYCAARDDKYDVYTIGVRGGTERRLTDAEGLDDGPEYSPDGRYIYFNSERTGLMKIWRMKADGSEQEAVTHDSDYADWFPHPSPDGMFLVFLSYDKDVKGHPPNKDVALRIISLPDGDQGAESPETKDGLRDSHETRQVTFQNPPKALTRLFGGQGTINVPSWSPDSRFVAFVSYRLVVP